MAFSMVPVPLTLGAAHTAAVFQMGNLGASEENRRISFS
jgi:hypothetical protein